MDNGLVLDMVSLLPGCGVVVAAGADVVKTGAELAAGYIDKEQAKDHIIRDTIDATVGTITCGVAGAVEGAVAKTVVKGSGTVACNALKKPAA